MFTFLVPASLLFLRRGEKVPGQQSRRQLVVAANLVATNLDPVFYLFTGRKSLRKFAADAYQLYYSSDPGGSLGPPEALLGQLNRYGATHVVFMPNQHFKEEKVFRDSVKALAQKHPALLEMVYESDDSRYRATS